MKTAILTYHRIANWASDWKSHDVSLARFREQMERVDTFNKRNATAKSIEVTFDDGTADHMQAAIVLSRLSIVGTFFVITNRLDTAGYLSRAEVKRISDLGHRIGSHSITHRHLPSLDNFELHKELSDSRKYLSDLTGREIDWLAPPGGVLNDRSLSAALSNGYSVVRTMEWGYAALPLYGRVSCIPIFSFTTNARLDAILAGRASFATYYAKQCIKGLLGSNAYSSFRDTVAKMWRREQ